MEITGEQQESVTRSELIPTGPDVDASLESYSQVLRKNIWKDLLLCQRAASLI